MTTNEAMDAIYQMDQVIWALAHLADTHGAPRDQIEAVLRETGNTSLIAIAEVLWEGDHDV